MFVLLLASEGGWDDDKAVQGSLRLVAQCLAMGGTWCMKHPQTRRMMFLELNFMWSEQMGTSWTTFKKLATPDELTEQDDNLPAAATQEGQGPAAAGQSGGTERNTTSKGNGKNKTVAGNAGAGNTTSKGNGKNKTVAVKVDAGDTAPPTHEEKAKAEFNKLWADGARLRLHHDINRVSCTYIYIHKYIIYIERDINIYDIYIYTFLYTCIYIYTYVCMIYIYIYI